MDKKLIIMLKFAFNSSNGSYEKASIHGFHNAKKVHAIYEERPEQHGKWSFLIVYEDGSELRTFSPHEVLYEKIKSKEDE